MLEWDAGVDREPHIKPVRSDGIGRFENAGIVAQHIKFCMLFGYGFRKCLDIGKALQIGHLAFNAPLTL